ncbi:MAG TPA: MgtC/SapB family protein [Candidatus Angelobacter sp.]|nr:MgtC/SapB family protein [Candidatus Angelobacter sp.]
MLLQPFTQASISAILSKTVTRLTLAAILGGVIGLERELKHHPAGLRTNMFIAFGSAMFTILSAELAGEFTGDHTRIAAQIIPGIGFIGAGSILHSKGGVVGLTTAATLFVVASIGMACGAGLYMTAIFATILIFFALQVLGAMERRLSLKPLLMNYSVVAEKKPNEIVVEVTSALEDTRLMSQGLRLTKVNGQDQVTFGVEGTRNEHKALMDRLRQSNTLSDVQVAPGDERE